MKILHSFIGVIIALQMTAQPLVFQSTGPGAGGYMYSPAINPFEHEQLFLVCDMAGVYRSDNGGASWEMYHYNELVSSVKAQVQFTSDPQVMYTIRRIETPGNAPYFRAQPVKSTDGGLHWTPLNDPTSTGVHRLLADPNSSQRLLLNEYDRLFFSSNGGQSFTEVYHPADDQMWLGGAFWDGSNIYVGTNKGLLVSHNGGQSFSIENHSGIPPGTGIFQLAGAKQANATRLFAVLTDTEVMYAWNDVLDMRPSLSGFLRMNYSANAAWTNARSNIPSGSVVQWVDLALQNTSVVYAAAEDQGLPQIFKSTDGGASWTNVYKVADNENITTGWGGEYGAFSYYWGGAALGFDVAPNDPDVLLVTDGYVHKSTDGGANWTQLYVTPGYENAAGIPSDPNKPYRTAGLNVTTTHQLLWLAENELFAASTDIGNQYSVDGGQSWSFARNVFYPWQTVGAPNWYNIVRHPADGRLFAAVSEMNDAFLAYRITDDAVYGYGMVLGSSDKGMHWDTLHEFGHPVVWLALDEAHPNVMYASVVDVNEGGIYKTTDAGQHWNKLPAPPRTEGHPYNIRLLEDGGILASYSARAMSDGLTLTESSGVFYSPDGGNTWYDRTGPGMQYYTKDVVIYPHDSGQNTWYATVWGEFNNFPGTNNAGNGGLYRSHDRGLNWTRVYAHERAESVSFHPALSDVAYLSVENEGLFYTDQLPAAAPAFSRVNAFPFYRPKRMFFNPYKAGELWVSTMGGALWYGDHPITPVTETANVSTEQQFDLFPNPGSSGGTIQLLMSASMSAKKCSYSIFDHTGACRQAGLLEPGQNSVSLEKLPAGVYQVGVQEPESGTVVFQKLVLL